MQAWRREILIELARAAFRRRFRVVNRYVGNLAPLPGVFPNYPDLAFVHQIETAMFNSRWQRPTCAIVQT